MLAEIHLIYLTYCTLYLSLAYVKCSKNTSVHLQWGEVMEGKPISSEMPSISYNEYESQSEECGMWALALLNA